MTKELRYIPRLPALGSGVLATDASKNMFAVAPSAGWLKNDGSNNLTWTTPTASDVGAVSTTVVANQGNGIDPNTALTDLQSGYSSNTGSNRPADWIAYQTLARYNGGSIQLGANVNSSQYSNGQYWIRTKNDTGSGWGQWSKIFTTLAPPTTAQVTESGNLYFTVARARDGVGSIGTGYLKGNGTTTTVSATIPVTDIVGANTEESVCIDINVRMATTSNITLSGLQTLDGVTAVAGDRVLVKNQTATAENGVYVAGSGAWTRAPGFDAETEMLTRDIFVQSGTALKGTWWTVSNTGSITVGTTGIGVAMLPQGIGLASSQALSAALVAGDNTALSWNSGTAVMTHATGDGFHHVPATGTTNSGKFLKAGATAGSEAWTALSSSDITTALGYTPASGGAYLPLAGGVLTGPVTFANNTWNSIGDDVQIGDINSGNTLGLRGMQNNAIGFIKYGTGPSVGWNGAAFSIPTYTEIDSLRTGAGYSKSAPGDQATTWIMVAYFGGADLGGGQRWLVRLTGGDWSDSSGSLMASFTNYNTMTPSSMTIAETQAHWNHLSGEVLTVTWRVVRKDSDKSIRVYVKLAAASDHSTLFADVKFARDGWSGNTGGGFATYPSTVVTEASAEFWTGAGYTVLTPSIIRGNARFGPTFATSATLGESAVTSNFSLLTFNTERPWKINKVGTGGSTQLHMVETSGNKTFAIGYSSDGLSLAHRVVEIGTHSSGGTGAFVNTAGAFSHNGTLVVTNDVTAKGLLLSNYDTGTSYYGIWPTGVTKSTNNFSFLTAATNAATYLNAGTSLELQTYDGASRASRISIGHTSTTVSTALVVNGNISGSGNLTRNTGYVQAVGANQANIQGFDGSAGTGWNSIELARSMNSTIVNRRLTYGYHFGDKGMMARVEATQAYANDLTWKLVTGSGTRANDGWTSETTLMTVGGGGVTFNVPITAPGLDTSTVYTGTTTSAANYWVCLATLSITSLYGAAFADISFTVDGQNVGTNGITGRVRVSVKQQASMSNNPEYADITISSLTHVTEGNLRFICVTNTASAKVFELWFQNPTTYGNVQWTPNFSSGATFASMTQVASPSTALFTYVANVNNVRYLPGPTASNGRLSLDGAWLGGQLVLGSTNQAGGMQFKRGSDGANSASIGYTNATSGGDFEIKSVGGSGTIRIGVNVGDSVLFGTDRSATFYGSIKSSGVHHWFANDVQISAAPNTNYSSGLTVERVATSGTTYHAGLGFYNNGVNASFLYYSASDGHFWHNRNTGSSARLWASDHFAQTDVNNWNTAYGWGSHASAGYAAGNHTHSFYSLTSIPFNFDDYTGNTTYQGFWPINVTKGDGNFVLLWKKDGIEAYFNATSALNFQTTTGSTAADRVNRMVITPTAINAYVPISGTSAGFSGTVTAGNAKLGNLAMTTSYARFGYNSTAANFDPASGNWGGFLQGSGGDSMMGGTTLAFKAGGVTILEGASTTISAHVPLRIMKSSNIMFSPDSTDNADKWLIETGLAGFSGDDTHYLYFQNTGNSSIATLALSTTQIKMNSDLFGINSTMSYTSTAGVAQMGGWAGSPSTSAWFGKVGGNPVNSALTCGLTCDSTDVYLRAPQSNSIIDFMIAGSARMSVGAGAISCGVPIAANNGLLISSAGQLTFTPKVIVSTMTYSDCGYIKFTGSALVLRGPHTDGEMLIVECVSTAPTSSFYIDAPGGYKFTGCTVEGIKFPTNTVTIYIMPNVPVILMGHTGYWSVLNGGSCVLWA